MMLTIFVCDPEAALYREMERQSILDERRWEAELDAEHAEEIRLAILDGEINEDELVTWPPFTEEFYVMESIGELDWGVCDDQDR